MKNLNIISQTILERIKCFFKLVGTNKDLIVSEVTKLIEKSDYYNKMSKANNPYGDGKASERIKKYLLND